MTCVCVLYFLSYREGEGIVLAKLKAKIVIVTNNSKKYIYQVAIESLPLSPVVVMPVSSSSCVKNLIRYQVLFTNWVGKEIL